MGFYNQLLESPIRLALGNFLNNELYVCNGFFIDVWSIVHFITGALLIWILIKLKARPSIRWVIFFILILGWEIFEILMSFNTNLFVLEKFADRIWDIIWATIAAGIVEFILVKNE